MNLKAIDPKDPNVEPYLFDPIVWDAKLVSILQSILERYIREGILDAATELNVTVSLDALNVRVPQLLEEYTGFLVRSVNEVTREKLRMALSDAIVNGATRRDLINKVQSILGSSGSRYRAEMIARTELTRAHARGRDAQYREMGAARKVWYAGIDACPFCRAIDGMTISIDEKFFGTGEQLIVEHEGRDINLLLDYEDVKHPPLHPHCNCEVVYEFD